MTALGFSYVVGVDVHGPYRLPGGGDAAGSPASVAHALGALANRLRLAAIEPVIPGRIWKQRRGFEGGLFVDQGWDGAALRVTLDRQGGMSVAVCRSGKALRAIVWAIAASALLATVAMGRHAAAITGSLPLAFAGSAAVALVAVIVALTLLTKVVQGRPRSPLVEQIDEEVRTWLGLGEG